MLTSSASRFAILLLLASGSCATNAKMAGTLKSGEEASENKCENCCHDKSKSKDHGSCNDSGKDKSSDKSCKEHAKCCEESDKNKLKD